MWFGRSSWRTTAMRERRTVTNRAEGRIEFENQGPVAYSRLCPTALGSVPPSASTQQQSDTQPRPDATPLTHCMNVAQCKLGFIWSRKKESYKITAQGPDDLANQPHSSVTGQ